MKKCVVFLVLMVFLTGCGKQADHPSRVVTGIDVTYLQGENTLTRQYTGQESLQVILNYLRLLRPHGPVLLAVDSHGNCQITLHYSQGPDTVYHQSGDNYLSKNGQAWEKINSAYARLLYPTLLLLPSDPEPGE